VAVVALVAFLGGVWKSGYNTAWRKADLQTKQVEIDTLKRDLEITEKAQIKAEQDAADLERARLDDEEQLDALHKLLANRPPDAGRGLTQSELDGLLGLK
jgi:DNA-directed RNA polymerase specialized sigma24 family protein